MLCMSILNLLFRHGIPSIFDFYYKNFAIWCHCVGCLALWVHYQQRIRFELLLPSGYFLSICCPARIEDPAGNLPGHIVQVRVPHQLFTPHVHGGTISVTSSPNVGSRFVVSLPAVVAPDPEGREAARQPPDAVCCAGRPVVLSVDDEAANQLVLRDILEDEGFELVEAGSGVEALAMLRTGRVAPSLILLDCMMPVMNGVETCQRIRQGLKLGVPVLIVSASQQQSLVVEALKAGANDCVRKPFDKGELLARLRMHSRPEQRKEQPADPAGDNLLKLILPQHIIERVKAGQHIIADRHQHVCVLFSDIVGFTMMCNRLPTTEIYGLLNSMFSRFDDLTDAMGVYKVETVGDAYMAVAGHDENDARAALGPPVYRVLHFAKQMLESVRTLTTSDGQPVQIRVGVHCGPAFSGVVGSKCPRYCFFGDTINTASRMESSGFPGIVHVSPAVVDAYNDGEAFRVVGARDIKGKGLMTTYMYNVDPDLAADLMLRLAAQRQSTKDADEAASVAASRNARSVAVSRPPTPYANHLAELLTESGLDPEEWEPKLRQQGFDISSLVLLTLSDMGMVGVEQMADRVRLHRAIRRAASQLLQHGDGACSYRLSCCS